MTARAEKIRQLEAASEERTELISQRDAASEQLREQIAENGRLREQRDGLKAAAAARQAQDAERRTLVELAHETILQLRTQLGA